MKEKDVFDQIEHIKKGLEEIWNKKDFEKRQNFTPEELSIISKIKKELTKKRKELFEIRKELIGTTKNTEQWVKFFNIYAIPLFIVVVFGLMKVKKVRKVSFCKPLFNKKAVWLVSAAVFSLILGCVGVMVQPEVNQRNVEGKPLFENLPEKINKVEKIKFENSKKQLVFRKNNGIWELSSWSVS